MRSFQLHSRRRPRGLRVALWVLLLLAGNALQVIAATHWHGDAVVAADSGGAPQAPAGDGRDQDGCLLCQLAAHAGGAAPPCAPWSLVVAGESRATLRQSAAQVVERLRPAHSWQGRAPPQV